MSDPLSGGEPRRTLLERLSALLLRAPDDREQLLELLRTAHDRELLDDDALSMIEGVLQVAELSARDIMVPRSRIDAIEVCETPEQFLPTVIRTAHSRFPVFEKELDQVVGILHAKDLLRLFDSQPATLRDLLRPAPFIPESKKLNVLLREFRANRGHLAIVVDEYGGVAGLITIEDVLEQIVGEIEDEFDVDPTNLDILSADVGGQGPRFRVRATTALEEVNRHFGTALSHDAVETIGGLVTERLGRVPRRGDQLELEGLRIEVLRADPRQAHWLMIDDDRARAVGGSHTEAGH